jgi:hypothetical protein
VTVIREAPHRQPELELERFEQRDVGIAELAAGRLVAAEAARGAAGFDALLEMVQHHGAAEGNRE